MKNGHGGSSGRPGYAKALTFLFRFNRDTTRSNGFLLYIYIYGKRKSIALFVIQGRITLLTKE